MQRAFRHVPRTLNRCNHGAANNGHDEMKALLGKTHVAARGQELHRKADERKSDAVPANARRVEVVVSVQKQARRGSEQAADLCITLYHTALAAETYVK